MPRIQRLARELRENEGANAEAETGAKQAGGKNSKTPREEIGRFSDFKGLPGPALPGLRAQDRQEVHVLDGKLELLQPPPEKVLLLLREVPQRTGFRRGQGKPGVSQLQQEVRAELSMNHPREIQGGENQAVRGLAEPIQEHPGKVLQSSQDEHLE